MAISATGALAGSRQKTMVSGSFKVLVTSMSDGSILAVVARTGCLVTAIWHEMRLLVDRARYVLDSN
jgi:hypothetical protein